ncbi:MAG TPA: polysaccharide biosynthesis C-terminal domain-containing protein, partial [Gammaproteobacteria bacterium]
YSTLLSSLTVGLVLAPWAFARTGFAWDAVRARLLLAFGAPLILASLGNFALAFGERFFLVRLAGLEETGIYALGYKLGVVLWVFAVAPLFTSWEAQRFEVAKRTDAGVIEARVFLWFSLGVIACGLGLALFARDLFRVMSAPEFWRAHEIVPLIVLAYLLQAWTQFGNFGLLHGDRTRVLAQATLAAAAVMALACLWLVPAYAAHGAALATLIAYAARFALVWFAAQRCYRMTLPWGRVLLALGLASAAFGVAQALRAESLLASVGVNASVFVVTCALIAGSPALGRAERRALAGGCRELLARLRYRRFSAGVVANR